MHVIDLMHTLESRYTRNSFLLTLYTGGLKKKEKT